METAREGPGGPHIATATSTSLLEGLRDPANEAVWREFVARYRPVLLRFARRLGVPGQDAEDVAQTSLFDFSRAYVAGAYARERGRLRDWLFGIVHNRVRGLRRRPEREVQAPEPAGETAADFHDQLPAPEEAERLWEEEWRDAVLRQCLGEVRRDFGEPTYEAFRRFALEGRPAHEVARELGLSRNAVYGSKRRVLRRLRELRASVEETW